MKTNIISRLNSIFSAFTNLSAKKETIINEWDVKSNGLWNWILPQDAFAADKKLLVLGLNPSAIILHKKEIPFSTALQEEQVHAVAQSDADLVKGFVGGISYFTALHRIAASAGFGSFAYIDLFKLRKTSSDDLRKAIKKHYGKDTAFTAFINSQIKLTLEQILEASPRVILVNNSMASSCLPTDRFLYGEPDSDLKHVRDYILLLGVTLTLDEETDTYVLRYQDFECRVFLSEMTSGGALGNHAIGRIVKDLRQFA